MSEEAPPKNTSHQLIPRITPWFERAFARHAPPDEIVWEISLVQFPTPTEGQFWGLLAVYAHIPGQVLGTVIMANQQLQPYSIDEAGTDEFVRQLVENLRKSRSQQEQAILENAKQAARNGQAPPTNGLIVPGR